MHRYDFVTTHPSGVDEFLCPKCGRRVLLRRSPYKRLILDEGTARDEVHLATRGAVSDGSVRIYDADVDDDFDYDLWNTAFD